MQDRDRIRLKPEDRPVEERGDVVVREREPRVRRREEVGEGLGGMQLELPEALNLTRDRVRWGPIWAGFFTALTTIILLGLLGVAVGLTAASAGAAGQAAPPEGTGMGAAIWGGLTALLAFLLGGWVAGRTAAVFDRKWGAWNGALVFLVAVPITLFLAGQGLGFLVGTLGNFPGLMGGAQPAPGAGQAEMAQAARNAAWGTLIGLLLGLAAAAIGGALGTRREISADRATAEVTRS